MYGGAVVAFVGIEDLIRSKETERDDDWRDVARLEEIADERRLSDRPIDVAAALVKMRSRRGFERALALGLYDDAGLVSDDASRVAGPLRSVTLGSARHLALVEAVRRLHRQAAVAADHADKLRALGRADATPTPEQERTCRLAARQGAGPWHVL